MRDSTSAPDGNDDAPVTIATFPNPYEAGLAYAALGSQRIPALIHNDHGQYLSAGSWVQVQVARGDSELATALLERGPLGASAGADEGDDMGSLRAQRRITLARWFLYAGALSYLLYGFLLPLSVVALALAVWSIRHPRPAFAIACVLQTVVVLVLLAFSGPTGLISLIPLVAFYLAWECATPAPQPSLLASPYPRTCSIAIGDSWQVGKASDEPTQRPTWILHDLGLFLLALVVIWALSMSLLAG